MFLLGIKNREIDILYLPLRTTWTRHKNPMHNTRMLLYQVIFVSQCHTKFFLCLIFNHLIQMYVIDLIDLLMH